MNPRTDVAVYSPQDGLQLVVEVKSLSGVSEEWVRQMRRNLLAHAVIPNTPYFLLVLSDFIYLWKNSDPAMIDSPPDYKVETPAVLDTYLRRLPKPLSEISESSLELLINSWLREVVNTADFDLNDPSQRWIIESGLYDAIRRGSVVTEPAL